MFRIICLFALLASCIAAAPALGAVADFENFGLPANSVLNGSGGQSTFISGGAGFVNEFDPDFNAWEGFAVSTTTNTQTPGFANQYSAMADHDNDGGSTAYGVAFQGFSSNPTIMLPFAADVDHVYVTNTAYAFYSMRDGDMFAKQFGGETGDDPDWFLLTFVGFDLEGQETGRVDFYLADYRFDDNSQDYIVDDWTMVDLAGLGQPTVIGLVLTSSDVGDFGMNTPAYAAIDDLTYTAPGDGGNGGDGDGGGGGCVLDAHGPLSADLLLLLGGAMLLALRAVRRS